MRLGLFDGGRLGVVRGDQVIDISAVVADGGAEGRLAAVIRSGVTSFDDELLARSPARALSDVVWEAPLPRPGKVIGAPANYYEHIEEMTGSATILEYGIFLKASTSVIGPGESIELPYTDVRIDHEGELAIVIGKGGRNISIADALDHVFGYTCVLDISVRSTEDRSTRKSFDTFTPLGPTVVTADELPDAGSLDLRLDINGEQRQATNTSKLIYGIAELIAYSSSVMTLEPGDVIASGTPAGVGPINDGDVITLEIERIGILEVPVTAASAIAYADRPGPLTALQRS